MALRSDVVGSLLRPPDLLEARAAVESGRLSAREFKRIEDRAVDEAVRLQEAAGLDVVTDGEMRRYAFFGHMVEALAGFDKHGGWAIPFRDEQGEELIFKRPVVVEKLAWRRGMCGEEFAYLRARANRREVEELVRLGCTYVQIDAPQYAALLDPELRAGYVKRGSDPDRLIDACIEMDNAVIGRHPGVTFGLHICRGNNQSKFYASGGYEPIKRVFEKSRFQRFLLEYDDERSGDFDPLRVIPADREVVLGLVTTKKPRLESVDELRRRIEAAAKHVPLERLALSPQCGFASTLEGNRVTPDDQRKKLERVAEVARLVWGR